MDFNPHLNAIKAIQSDKTLLVTSNLQARVEALETLAFIDEVIQHNPQAVELIVRAADIKQLQQHLESINQLIFDDVREMMQSTQVTPAQLRMLFDTYTSYHSGKQHHVHIDYEALDVLLAGVLFTTRGPEPALELQPEMVQWEASPVSVILDLLDQIPFKSDDVFMDLGSGLGNVAVLVNKLSGIPTVGIERDPAYCRYAMNLAKKFSLDNLSFINADVRDTDLSRGTIFYLFTPFVASILRSVMDKIQKVAMHHPIYVCSFGPCTPEIAELSWLKNINGSDQHEFKLAIFTAGQMQTDQNYQVSIA